MVYRWYKILSPRIELEVECGEFNQETGVLFVEIFQVGLPFHSTLRGERWRDADRK